MQLTTLLPVLLSSLSLTTAAPQSAPSTTSTWNGTHLDIGCSPGGCAWRFDLAAPKSNLGQSISSPAFNTYCEGSSYNATPCADKNITVQVKPLSYPKFNIWVEQHWSKVVDQSQQDYWLSGNVNVTESNKDFTIKPDQFYGVA